MNALTVSLPKEQSWNIICLEVIFSILTVFSVARLSIMFIYHFVPFLILPFNSGWSSSAT